jgi:hypothetical protein
MNILTLLAVIALVYAIIVLRATHQNIQLQSERPLMSKGIMMRERTIWAMVILTIVTFGFYTIYWIVGTKRDLNRMGAQIPTSLLFFIPFANFYYLYLFAAAFCKYVLKDPSQEIAYFLLITFLMPIGTFIYQIKINDMIHRRLRTESLGHEE